MKSKLYYEAHVTIEPVFDERLEDLKKIAFYWGFRVADLLMVKRPNDTPERSKYDTFMTARNTDYDIIHDNTIRCVDNLFEAGFKVWRYKIEDTLLDVRLVN